jgi:homoserine dehydrogenase
MKEIKVAIFGFGTIGTGVVKLLLQNSALITEKLGAKLTLKNVVDLDLTTDRGVKLAAGILTDDAEKVLTDPEVAVTKQPGILFSRPSKMVNML